MGPRDTSLITIATSRNIGDRHTRAVSEPTMSKALFHVGTGFVKSSSCLPRLKVRPSSGLVFVCALSWSASDVFRLDRETERDIVSEPLMDPDPAPSSGNH